MGRRRVVLLAWMLWALTMLAMLAVLGVVMLAWRRRADVWPQGTSMIN